METIYYMNPALGAPYARPQPINPFEDAYRIALRYLEDSYTRQRDLLYRCLGSDPYYMNRDLYELDSWFHFQRDRLERKMKESLYNQQRYYYNMVNDGYGYGLRQNRWSFPSIDYSNQMIPYQYTYTYLNSKETTPVATETKKYIIVDSSPDPVTYYDDGDGFPSFKTLADAEKEAQELTRDNPDLEYTIYQSVKKYKVAGTPLETTVFV